MKRNRLFVENSPKELSIGLSISESYSGTEDPSGIFGQTSSSGGTPVSPETQQPYERRFSFFSRIVKLVTSPSEAMKDIALSPDYSGPIAIIIVETIIAIVLVAGFFSKINLVGSSDVTEIWGSVVSLVIGILIVASFFVYVVFWVVKSLLVQHLANSQSGWDFKTAASVTGYAYIADLIFLFIETVIVLSVTPSFIIDVSNFNQAQASAQIMSQIGWIATFTVPLNLIALVWKSYLGGLGAHYGTKEQCSVGKAFAVFFILALIGLAISFATRRY